MFGYAIFDTAVGRCGVAWGPDGIVSVQLPESREAATRARLLACHPGAVEAPPPADVQRGIDDITALLRGEARDCAGLRLDMQGVPDFHRRVYEIARTIGPGATATYGEIATRLGSRGLARAVGQALGRNPFPLVVPCHRVLAAGGRVGGFSAPGGIITKLRLLAIEGRHGTGTGGSLFDGDGGLGFDPDAAVAHLRSCDAKLARLMDRVGPFRLQLKQTSSLFLALAEAIVYQQLTGKAAATIFARVRALFPRAHEGFTPEQILRVRDERLRAAGLSQGKLLALRDLARRAAAGEIPTLEQASELPDDALIERLTQVRGIGQWTVEMILIFRLGRPDVLPVDDYGVRKGFALAYRRDELPKPQELATIGRKWTPYRTVASWYFWRALEQPGSP
jgi:methylated-DNA-[protein]-cysteine S-methyltransferase